MSNPRIEVLEVSAVQLPELTKDMLEAAIESADDLILNKTPEKCSKCEQLNVCKEKAVTFKAAAVKLANSIDDFTASINKMNSNKGGCY